MTDFASLIQILTPGVLLVMIASLALIGALAATTEGPTFRFAVRAQPGQTVAVEATASPGWLAAFCTSEVCSIGHVSLKIFDRGVRQIKLHLHRIADGAHHGYVTVREGTASIVLHF
jgi:hypothetical protein